MKTNMELYKNCLNPATENETEYTSSVCSHCPSQVSCCETMGCELSPRDLKQIDAETIANLLRSGMVVVDYWDGDLEFVGYDDYHEVPYLRARVRSDFEDYVHGAWWSACTLLTDSGCPIEFAYRPYYGRTMGCKYTDIKDDQIFSTKQRSCLEWRPYISIINEALKIIHKEQGKDLDYVFV